MKIEGRRARIVEALREGRVSDLVDASPAEVKAALDAFSGDERTKVERFLAQSMPHGLDHATSAPAGTMKAHELRAEKRKPWWSGISTSTLSAPIHQEPTRDVEVGGVKLTKDDVASMLRSLAR